VARRPPRRGVRASPAHLFTTIYLVGKLQDSSELYGTLGAAAAVLLWLYLLGYAMVGSAILNATLWFRQHDPPGDSAGSE
jgi:uncharacterized BrkB/YihY/UPF0761 family membrane protein